MRKLSIEMPIVARCGVRSCAYNVREGCHARAITVGDGDTPGCDTFFTAPDHTHSAQPAAGVGACKVSACKYNDDFECTAEQIEVGRTPAGEHCLTFSARP